jgi:hypothetical protein
MDIYITGITTHQLTQWQCASVSSDSYFVKIMDIYITGITTHQHNESVQVSPMILTLNIMDTLHLNYRNNNTPLHSDSVQLVSPVILTL